MEGSIVSRRHAFKIAGLAGAAAAFAARASDADTPATAPATLPQGAGFYRHRVGDAEITVISDGGLPMSPPFPAFGANASEDEVNRLLVDHFIDPKALVAQVNALLVRVGDGPYVLIDTGAGRAFGPGLGFVRQNLAAAGVAAEAVRHVVFTHLHPDHVGGTFDEGGKPVYTNATFHVHNVERDFWAGTPDLSKSGVPEAMRPTLASAAKGLIDALGPKLQTFAGPEHTIVRGVVALHAPGHTPGHCAIGIGGGADMLVCLADAAHNSVISFARPEWHVGFDTDREQAVVARKTLYGKLVKDRLLTARSRLPFPPARPRACPRCGVRMDADRVAVDVMRPLSRYPGEG